MAKSQMQITPPITVQRYTLDSRTLTAWPTISDIGHLRASSQTITAMSEKTDRLFDICRCKCTIQRCADVADCAGCNVQAHVTRTCPKGIKIPKSELMFLPTQLEKASTSLG